MFFNRSKAYQIYITGIILLGSLSLHAQEEYQQLDLNAAPSLSPEGRQQLNEAHFNAGWVIPLNMPNTQDQEYVSQQIVEQTFDSILDGVSSRNTFVGRMARTLQGAMETDIEIAPVPTAAVPAGVEKPVVHRFQFGLQALERVAQISYEGVVKANCNFNAITGAMNLEVAQEIQENTQLILRHRTLDAHSELLVTYDF